MATLKYILSEIAEGHTTFHPHSSEAEHMVEFQPIAKALCFAYEEGYLESFLSHKESESGNDWYDLIVVQMGLSHKGDEFRRQSSAVAEQETGDIIQIKPTLWGVGIDLNALWKRWKSRKRQRS